MTAHAFNLIQSVSGSGGSAKSGGSNASESQNTLRSNARARLVEIISEGEIEGIVGGAKGIFFDQTPLQNNDDTFNFKGVVWEQRTGLPDQTHVDGFSVAETPVTVGARVKFAETPPVRTIVDQNVDAVRMIVSLPSLVTQDNKGNLIGASVSWVIETRPNGGSWSVRETVDIVKEKCVSQYQRAHYIRKPTGMAPGTSWDIRVRRLTADSTETKLQNETHWDSYTLVVEGKFIYPNCALVAMSIDAQQFGTSIPSRSYRVRGLKIQVPTNYDPITRSYTGIWDGTFKKAWTNNPVWIWNDLLLNNRYGLGEFISASIVDKWGLYQIARYCDELVPSGFKDANGEVIFEPRFVYNGSINSIAEAYKVLERVATAFRGMGYWALGQVIATADMPADPAPHGLYSPADVIDGHFEYSGTSMKARHSVALVTWNDPQDFYRPAVELVQNDEMLQRFGWRQTDVQAYGVTSRGQANRYGQWILDTEQYETETVTFKVSWQGAQQKPGDIILVSDPRKAQIRTGGRILAVNSATSFKLDSPYEFESFTSNLSHTLYVVGEDGNVYDRKITSYVGDTITIQSAFPSTPIPNAMWTMSEDAVEPRRYRVMRVEETEGHIYTVSALFHDPSKYARVEQKVTLAPVAYSRPRDIVSQPINLTAIESLHFLNGVAQSSVTLSWTPAPGFTTKSHRIWAQSPNGIVEYGEVTGATIDIPQTAVGDWVFFVSTVSPTGKNSIAASLPFSVFGWDGATGPTVTSLQIKGGGLTFEGTSATLTWTNSLPSDVIVYDIENIVRIYDLSDNLLRTATVRQNSFNYSFETNVNDGGPRRSFKVSVTAKSVTGVESAPTVITVTNPTPSGVTATLATNAGSLMISVPFPIPSDYEGMRIWLSNSLPFTPNSSNYYYDASGRDATLPLPDGIYYVWIGAFDTFSRTDYSVSYCGSITVSAVDLGSITIPKLGADAATLFDQAQQDLLPIFDAIRVVGEVQNSQSKRVESRIGKAVAYFEESIDVLADADAAAASRVTTLEATVSHPTTGLPSTLARLVQEETTRANADAAEATARTALASQVNNPTTGLAAAHAAVSSEASTRSTNDAAIASSVTTLSSSLGTEITNRTNADAALSTSISAVSSAVTTEATTRASADTALTNFGLTLSASAAGTLASAQFRMTTVSGVAGVAARVGFQSGVYTGGAANWASGAALYLDTVETAPGSGVYTSHIVGEADKFYLVNGTTKKKVFEIDTVNDRAKLLAADIGTVVAGVLKSPDETFYIDLLNKRILIG